MQTPPLPITPLVAAAVYILGQLPDGCECYQLMRLLDLSAQDMEQLESELLFSGFIKKQSSRLQLGDNILPEDQIRRILLDEPSGHLFQRNTLPMAIRAYLQEDYSLFTEVIHALAKKYNQENAPFTLYCLYIFFTRLFKEIELQTNDKELCHSIINTCSEIQDVAFLYPFGTEEQFHTNMHLRKLAQEIGDERTICYLDLQAGALNVNVKSINSEVCYFTNMKIAKDKIFRFGDQDIIIKCSPMIELYYLINCEYDEVINFFHRVLQVINSNNYKYYSRLLYIYPVAAAINKGNYDLAHEFVDWGKNEAVKANMIADLSVYDSYTAYLYILEGKFDEALQLINDILENHNYSIASYASLRASRMLSFLHYQQGNIRNSYASFVSLVVKRPQEIFHNNYLVSDFMLELLGAYALAKMPPIDGLDINEELALASKGPVKLIQSTANRLNGELLAQEKGWGEPDVRTLLEKSLAIAQAVKAPVQKAHALIALSRMHKAMGNTLLAGKQLEEAWSIHKIYRQPSWPEDIPPPEIQDTLAESDKDDALGAFCIKLFKNRNIRANFKNEQGFFHELLSILLSTMEMTMGEVYRINGGTQKPLAHINYNGLLSGDASGERRFSALLEEVLNTRSSRLYADGRLLESDWGKLESMPDSTRINLVLFCPVTDEQDFVFILDGTLKVCKDSLKSSGLPPVLEAFLRPDIEDFLLSVTESHRVAVNSENPAPQEGHELLYCSKEMDKLVDLIDSLADKKVNILVIGESGVGKELVARRIHSRSNCKGQFVPVNIANIPNDLFESEFFGHEKGSFTGAHNKKSGLFEMADNGTLFLDEIGDTPYLLQVKLLRVIQEKEFMRIGGIRSISSNFRLVSATNKNLVQAVADGMFREDLYYRLNAVTLKVPPLRERKDDIPYLAKMFLRNYAQEHGLPDRVFPDLILEHMCNYEWPGNVRQLKHFAESYCLLNTRSDMSFLDTLGHMQIAAPGDDSGDWPNTLPDSGMDVRKFFTARPTLQELNDLYFEHVYEQCCGVVGGKDGMASVLGMSRTTVYTWIERLGLGRHYKKTLVRRS